MKGRLVDDGQLRGMLLGSEPAVSAADEDTGHVEDSHPLPAAPLACHRAASLSNTGRSLHPLKVPLFLTDLQPTFNALPFTVQTRHIRRLALKLCTHFPCRDVGPMACHEQ